MKEVDLENVCCTFWIFGFTNWLYNSYWTMPSIHALNAIAAVLLMGACSSKRFCLLLELGMFKMKNNRLPLVLIQDVVYWLSNRKYFWGLLAKSMNPIATLHTPNAGLFHPSSIFLSEWPLHMRTWLCTNSAYLAGLWSWGDSNLCSEPVITMSYPCPCFS